MPLGEFSQCFSTLVCPLGGIVFHTGDCEFGEPQSSACCCAEYHGDHARHLAEEAGHRFPLVSQCPQRSPSTLSPRSSFVSVPPWGPSDCSDVLVLDVLSRCRAPGEGGEGLRKTPTVEHIMTFVAKHDEQRLLSDLLND